MAVTISNETMERLAFIRQLYHLGVEQSHRPEPANAVGILLFHDTVELFLQLASEHLGVGKNEKTFMMDYFGILAPKMPNGVVEGRQGMKRLNEARKSLKHGGIRPLTTDIDSLRASTTEFFESNSRLIFDIDFDQISLARLVLLPEARQYLEESESLIAANDLEHAVDSLAIAYAYVMRQQNALEPTQHHRSRMSFGGSISGPNALLEHEVQALGKQIETIGRAVNTLQERVVFLTLGISPASMESFLETTPGASIAFDGTPRLEGPRYKRLTPLTVEDVRFCYDFVVGIALALQRRSQ